MVGKGLKGISNPLPKYDQRLGTRLGHLSLARGTLESPKYFFGCSSMLVCLFFLSFLLFVPNFIYLFSL